MSSAPHVEPDPAGRSGPGAGEIEGALIEPSAPLTIEARVVEVTLFEDRARVVRRGAAALPAGAVKVRVAGVAPVVSDPTVTVRLETPGARVVDSRVRRRLLTRTTSPDEARTLVRELEEQAQALDGELRALKAKIGVLEHQVQSLDQLGELTLDEIADDVAWGRGATESWTTHLDGLRRQDHELQARLVELRFERDAKKRTRERLSTRLQALRNPSHEERATLEAELSVEVAGEHTLRFEYVVPGACWRPYHTARLGTGAVPTVEFRTEGCVWQNTGEDWSGVRLAFSTERPSLGTEPPGLTSDVLSVKRKEEAVLVETREQEVTTTGLGATPQVASAQLPGIDDGGRAVRLAASRPATVPSDGRAYRVPLSCFEAEAQVELVALPELVPAVLRKTLQANGGATPILAGPVDLVRNGGFSGRTSVLFVAPGERFVLGWGPESELRVERHTETSADKSRALSAWETRRHRTLLRLSSLGTTPNTVKVTERVPVSEIDKVRIQVHSEETTDGISPDEHGFLHWTVHLAPGETRKLDLAYSLKKHQDVKGLE